MQPTEAFRGFVKLSFADARRRVSERQSRQVRAYECRRCRTRLCDIAELWWTYFFSHARRISLRHSGLSPLTGSWFS